MTDHAASLGQQVRHDVVLGTSAHRSPLGWLKEYGQDASIALFTLAAIASYLLLRYDIQSLEDSSFSSASSSRRDRRIELSASANGLGMRSPNPNDCGSSSSLPNSL